MTFDTEFYTIVFKIIVSVLGVTITYFVIPFLTELTERYKNDRVESFVKAAVFAAEQVIKGEKKGSLRKDRVLTMVSDWLAKQHIVISESELDAMIESLVYAMNHPEEAAK